MSCQRQFFALFVFLVYYSIMRIWWLNSDGGWFMNELCYLNRWQPEEAQTSPCPGPLTFSWVWPSWWVDCVGPHSKPILVIIILYYTCTSVLSKSQIKSHAGIHGRMINTPDCIEKLTCSLKVFRNEFEIFLWFKLIRCWLRHTRYI